MNFKPEGSWSAVWTNINGKLKCSAKIYIKKANVYFISCISLFVNMVLFYVWLLGRCKVPWRISEVAKSLLSGLLVKNPDRHLGGGHVDADEVRKHPFYAYRNHVTSEIYVPVQTYICVPCIIIGRLFTYI